MKGVVCELHVFMLARSREIHVSLLWLLDDHQVCCILLMRWFHLISCRPLCTLINAYAINEWCRVPGRTRGPKIRSCAYALTMTRDHGNTVHQCSKLVGWVWKCIQSLSIMSYACLVYGLYSTCFCHVWWLCVEHIYTNPGKIAGSSM